VTVRSQPPGPLRSFPVGVLVVLLLAALVAACAGTAVTARPSGSAGPSSVAPGAAASSGPSSADVAPSATPWPGGIVEAVVILGKADASIEAAGADLGAAAAYQDLDAMWGAADGLATLLERLETQVPRIADYPETAPAAAAYQKAFPDMLAGARQLRDAIKAGDAAGIAAGSERLAKGLEQYQAARRLMGPIVERALLMQRLILK
jgi:hypothetical protein